jgi:tRNA pseudouridine38-40 synthase
MATYRADLEYEGTRYRGWQIQVNARSIAGELHRAVAAAGGQIVDIGGSGRTDAGVHALGQTAHVRLAREVDPERFRRAVNEALPADIHLKAFRRAHDRFHARHDAVSRSYLYQISRRRTALAKRFVWWVKQPIDVDRMARAAAALEGRHDFRHLCESPGAQASTTVIVEHAEVAGPGDLVLVRLVASHFLWKMMRRVVGALVRTGTGELSPEELKSLLEPGEEGAGEKAARWTAPPSGLFLERVVYPGEAPLGELVPAIPVGFERLQKDVFLGAGGQAATGRGGRNLHRAAHRGPSGPRR